METIIPGVPEKVVVPGWKQNLTIRATVLCKSSYVNPPPYCYEVGVMAPENIMQEAWYTVCPRRTHRRSLCLRRLRNRSSTEK